MPTGTVLFLPIDLCFLKFLTLLMFFLKINALIQDSRFVIRIRTRIQKVIEYGSGFKTLPVVILFHNEVFFCRIPKVLYFYQHLFYQIHIINGYRYRIQNLQRYLFISLALLFSKLLKFASVPVPVIMNQWWAFNLLQILVAAGGKWGSVGLWDAQDTGGPQNGVHLYMAHR